MKTFLARPSLWVAFIAASLSGIAILIHAAHWMTLTYTLTVLAPLTALVFVALVVRAGRGREDVLLNRIAAGFIAGILGLIAYDLVRLVVMLAGVPFNPFRPIEVYGLLILDTYDDTLITKIVGWSFHIWNGLSFALMYTLTFGRGRILYAVIWGLVLETTLLVTYPTIFGLLANWAFVTISLIGHIAYGLTIGYAARRFVKW